MKIHVKADPTIVYNGIKGDENYSHTVYEPGLKNVYDGHGSVRVIPLSKLNLLVFYHKGKPFEAEFTKDMGYFDVDMYSFIKRNVQRKNGDKIERITGTLVEELNKATGSSPTSTYFKSGVLPPEAYLSLLISISACCPNLKIESRDYAVIGVGTCIKLYDGYGNDGNGMISVNNEKYDIPMKYLFKAKVGDKGEVAYYDWKRTRRRDPKRYPAIDEKGSKGWLHLHAR